LVFTSSKFFITGFAVMLPLLLTMFILLRTDNAQSRVINHRSFQE
jgi:uncharacterized membrane protein